MTWLGIAGVCCLGEDCCGGMDCTECARADRLGGSVPTVPPGNLRGAGSLGRAMARPGGAAILLLAQAVGLCVRVDAPLKMSELAADIACHMPTVSCRPTGLSLDIMANRSCDTTSLTTSRGSPAGPRVSIVDMSIVAGLSLALGAALRQARSLLCAG